MFGFMGGYLPQPQMMPQYQPQMQPQRQPVCGRWLTAKSYAEVQQTPVPADGTQTIFMLENEPSFYLVSMQNGQKMVQGYTFATMGNTAPQTVSAGETTTTPVKADTEARIAKLERFAERMKELLGDEDNGKPTAPAPGPGPE